VKYGMPNYAAWQGEYFDIDVKHHTEMFRLEIRDEEGA